MADNDYFQQLKSTFRKIGEAFDAVEGSRLIPSFSTTTEEEYIPDPEQREEENRLNLKDTWVRAAETKPSSSFTRDFCNANSDFSFKFFVDGSVRSVRALDGIEGDFVYPIVIGQIGAASVTRDKETKPIKHLLDTNIILLLPLSKLSDTLRNQLKRNLIGTPLENKLFDPLHWRDAKGKDHYDDERDYGKLRSRASRRAKDLMADIEKSVVEKCVENLSEDSELIAVDGSLFSLHKETQISKEKLHQTIGISKSFSMTPLILMEEYLNRQDCIRQLMNLKEGERTDSIELHIDPDWVVSWYQRIRPREQVESPLDGIVKVDVYPKNYPACKSRDDRRKLSKSSEDWSNTWDLIAKLVYTERMPIPFHEERWHVLLYPVYCSEKLLKSSFLSIEVLHGLCTHILSGLGF
jgi:hypothetical protein